MHMVWLSARHRACNCTPAIRGDMDGNILKGNKSKNLPASTFLLDPFDMGMHATEQGIALLQSRISNWTRPLGGPARFVYWLMPATLDDKISRLSYSAKRTTDPNRAKLLEEARRHFELLQ